MQFDTDQLSSNSKEKGKITFSKRGLSRDEIGLSSERKQLAESSKAMEVGAASATSTQAQAALPNQRGGPSPRLRTTDSSPIGDEISIEVQEVQETRSNPKQGAMIMQMSEAAMPDAPSGEDDKVLVTNALNDLHPMDESQRDDVALPSTTGTMCHCPPQIDALNNDSSAACRLDQSAPRTVTAAPLLPEPVGVPLGLPPLLVALLL